MSLIHVIARHPHMILIAVTVFCGTCIVIPLSLRKLPNFSDPRLGFETRGTVLAQRLTAWYNLVEATSKSTGPFINNPTTTTTTVASVANKNKFIKKRKIKKNHTNITSKFIIITEQNNESDYTAATKTSHWKTLKELNKDNNHNFHEHVSDDGFFCGTPDERYSRIVLTTADNSNLFTYTTLMAMCRIQYQLMQVKHFQTLCDTVTRKRCCHPWSVVNYITLLHNRTSCLAITEQDVNDTLSLLQSCSQYYHNLKLMNDCHENDYCQIPQECGKHNAVYNILHYLTDVEFLPPNDTSNTFLKQSVIFLPIACSTKILPYYHAVRLKSLHFENVYVVAMEFGLKNALFDEYLIKDTWLIGLGGIVILFFIYLYTESLFLTLMTITAIIFSLAIAYFFYTFIFELAFFPFMNLLAIVVALGIGADDVFIFCKVWESERSERTSSVVEMVTATFHHAVLSMFVTSVTTAAAFYTSLVSSITVVCCFSVFAGTAVIANFILTITWLPACLVVAKYWCCSGASSCVCSCTCPCMSPTPPHWCFWENKLRLGRQALGHIWTRLEKCAVTLVFTFRYGWLVLFTCVAVLSVFVVVHYPGIQLPDYPEFQLFESAHPFEQYDLIYKQRFYFERLQKLDNSAMSNYYKLPLRFVWGIHPTDNGNYMDPHSKGSLEMDSTFDMAAPQSQEWLLAFCRRLRQQPFYMPQLGPLLPNCFIESFVSWMQRRCIDAIDQIDRSPCCETQHFPYARSVFETCIVQAMSDLYATPSQYLMPGVAGPKFSRVNFPAIQAVVVEYDSNYTYSMSYTYMDTFFKQVENWTQDQLHTAPIGMRNGWFISDFEFYDLQRVLSESTVLSICLAMTISFAVLLCVTLNILISVFAIITISCSIFSTIAILVLLGWKLNVLESIAVSTAIGLAVDFSLHYGVSYKLAGGNDRYMAARTALSNMCGPTAMAALTTAIAGALMLPSTVLPYIQIGVFLVVVMTVSWFYSTFLFVTILSIVGPEQNFGQFRYPVPKSWRRRRQQHSSITQISVTDTSVKGNHVITDVDGAIGAMPVTSTAALSHSESHELESLTNTQIQNQIHTKSNANGPQKVNGRKYFATTNQSPSAKSDITLILSDDT